MWKYILACVVVALAWVVALVFHAPWWLPVGVTLLVAGVLVGIFVFGRLQAKRAASELEKALASQAQAGTEGARPDMLAEIEEMTAEFHKALGALKSSQLHGGGRDALYALPWYMMIGPPGAGKSTALRNSGLNFPYLSDSNGGAVKGVGGTRNCDWWLTNEAVLLDTAGRWTTQGDDHDWFAFLDLLKKHRRRRPLNGLIVGVSIDQVLGTEDRATLAKRIRERIDEVVSRLKTMMPIYIVFTKCDLVPGFVESFDTLPQSERGQPWGFTAKISTPMTDVRGYFTEQFAALQEALSDRALLYMSEQRNADRREPVMDFTQQFGALREPLAEFVEHLFQDNVYGETPRLRGAYFTSGVQEGRPIDRLMQKMASSLGVGESVPTPVADAKSFFLHDVFTHIMFRDSRLAGPSEAWHRQQQLLQVIGAGMLFALAMFTLFVPLYAWSGNDSLLASTSAITRRFERGGPWTAEQLTPLAERVRELRGYEDEGEPARLGFGMYRDNVYGPVRDRFMRIIRDQWVAPLVAQDGQGLLRFGQSYQRDLDAKPTTEEHAARYLELKMHLLLTTPKQLEEPPPHTEQREWLARQLARRIGPQAAAAGETPDAWWPHMELFVDLLGEEPSFLMPRQHEAVRLSRLALSRISASDIWVQRLILELEGRGFELTLQQLIGSTGASLTSTRHVRGAFTRRAWDEYIRDRLSDAADSLLGEPWVLLETADSQGVGMEKARVLAAIRNQYFGSYIDEWRQFLENIRVTPPEDDAQSLVLLQELTRGQPSPMERLMAKVAENLDLQEPDPPVVANVAGQLQAATGAARQASQVAQIARVQSANTGRAIATLNAAAGVQVGPAGVQMAAPAEPESLAANDVTKHFRSLLQFSVPQGGEDAPPQPTGLNGYLEQLSFVRDALTNFRENPSDAQPLLERIQESRTRVQALIEEQEVGIRPLLTTLLWPPVEGATHASSRAVAHATNIAFCNDIIQAFDQRLGSHYPFSPEGSDASMEDFIAFYKPQDGKLWQFYSDRLSTDMPRDGEQFTFGTRLGRDAGTLYAQVLHAYLTQSSDVTDVFFPGNDDDLSMSFDIRIHPVPGVAVTSISVGGTTIDYYNGPEQWQRIAWPGEDPSAGASLSVRGAYGMQERVQHDGEWGLFRLLEQSNLARSNRERRVFTVAWDLQGHDVRVQVDIRPTRADSPLFGPQDGNSSRPVQWLRNPDLRVPRSIVVDPGNECTPNG